MIAGLLAGLAILGGFAVWLMVRCRLGFHGDTFAEQVFADGKVPGDRQGKRQPYILHWRCRRCQQLTTPTVLRPDPALMLQLYRWKREYAGRVVPMRKRA